jgi:hypothetical protein
MIGVTPKRNSCQTTRRQKAMGAYKDQIKRT